MIYEIGSKGLISCGVNENEKKNNLEIGRIIQLEGYNNPRYAIVKNLGISERFAYYGATYLVVNLADNTQSQKQAYTLKYLSEKKDNRIQSYITDQVLSPAEVLNLWEKSESKKKALQETTERREKHLTALETQGRELFKKHIPAEAQAIIVAIKDADQSDIQTDYFAHTETSTVILGWSKHKRDLFSEMRKAAVKIPETRHLGPGYSHFEARVVINEDIHSNGSYYNAGQYSHWHKELEEDSGHIFVFTTKEAAQAHIDKMGAPGTISFNSKEISFSWRIEEEELEHREKYSMGEGYYLKDGHGDQSGWRVEKRSKFHEDWDSSLYIAMAKRCIF